MSKDVTFQLDVAAASEILTEMAIPVIEQRGAAIASRAQSIASAMSSDPPDIEVTTAVGTIRRGTRAIATITTTGKDDRQSYIGAVALSKAKDAGRM